MSLIGTKRTCHDGLWMSVLGGETDIRQLGCDVAFWTQGGTALEWDMVSVDAPSMYLTPPLG